MRTGLAIAIGLVGVSGCGASARDPPAQPLPFSHRVHAGDNQIGCTSCHAYVARSPVAGIPSLAKCVGCHKFIAGDKPEIQKLMAAYDAEKPIEWVRVYRLPDHSLFTHERHIEAGLECKACHGDVARMDVLRQVTPLTMGWCLGCHEARHVSKDCWTCHK